MVFILALLAAGCTTTARYPGEQASPRQVFAVAMENLSERYIRPVNIEAAALAGIARLAAFDSTLRIAESGGAVKLSTGHELRARHVAPAKDDAYGWAWLTADLVAQARRNSSAIAELSDDQVYQTVFDGMLAGLDRYSRYTGPAAARRNRAARDGFGGLGVSIARTDDATIITQVHSGTPADRAGLKVDDRIVAIDGTPVSGLSLGSVVDRLRGPADSLVRLAIERDGARPLDFMLRRAHIVLPTVTARRDGGLLEIKITGFNQGTVGSLRRDLERAQREMGHDLKGVVLDLRGNPGGLLDQAVDVADLFLVHGRIITTRGRHPESNQVFEATPGELVRGIPLAVLINGRSASAAEIVAVALRDDRRAVTIGSTSFGKGTVQTIARLPNGAELTLTWARMLAPSGQTLDHQGIVPAICTAAGAERTETLLSALRAVRNGGLLPATMVRAESASPHFSREGRKACPPDASASPADLETARLVLGNAALYAQAVSEAPSVAKR